MNSDRVFFNAIVAYSFVGVLIQTLAPSAVAADAVAAEIIASWRKRQQAVEAVHYDCVGHLVYPRGSFNELLVDEIGRQLEPGENHPSEDYKSPIKYQVTLSFEHGWLKITDFGESFYPSTLSFHRTMKTLLFDGEKYQKHRPQAENPDTGKLAPDLYLHGPTYPVVFRVRDYPLLFGHGFVVCQDEFVDPSGGFQLDYASAGLKRTGTILLDNSRQVILRTAPRKIPGSYYEIWVDRAMADQVRRWRYFHWVSDKAQLLYDIQINYAKRDGIWLPSGWTFLTFDERQTPSRTLEMSVNHVDIEPDMQVNDFRIAPSEGMVVFDVPAGREYVVGNESADIEQLRSATGSWWPVALRVISLLAVAGLVSLFFWHRRRSDS